MLDDQTQEASSARCKNCDAPLMGQYCANCSQAADVHIPTTKELLHELLEGLTHSDSRLWRTLLSLWFKPGKLTEEYILGKRISYLPPFRLYLVVSVVFFILAPLMPTTEEVRQSNQQQQSSASRVTDCSSITIDGFAQHAKVQQQLRHACAEIHRDHGVALMHLVFGILSKALFVLLPLVAFFNMTMYWAPRYRYAEHLLFFVHLHAFFFSVAFVMLLLTSQQQSWPRMQAIGNGSAALLGCTAVVYTAMAVRRVFAKTWTAALAKTFVLSLIYLAMFALTTAGVFAVAFLEM
jgi:Protein of unknown function (DUF3667)